MLGEVTGRFVWRGNHLVVFIAIKKQCLEVLQEIKYAFRDGKNRLINGPLCLKWTSYHSGVTIEEA